MTYGNPSADDGTPEGGGFGAESAADGSPVGDSFGAKSDVLSPVYLFEHGDLNVVGDGGGEIVLIKFSAIPTDLDAVYRVKLANNATSALYPESSGCYSGYPGKGNDVRSSFGGRVLSFSMPRVPVGSYTIRYAPLQEGGAEPFSTMFTSIDGTLEVIRRLRSPAALDIKARLPELFQVGARSFRMLDDFSGDAHEEEQGQLDVLLSSIGEVFEQVHGSLFTRSTQDFEMSDTSIEVESTLRFPDTGHLWLGRGLFKYTGKDNDMFSGLSLVRGSREVIPEKSEVQYAEDYFED